METSDLAKIEVLRTKVFAHIKKCLAEDGDCKSYEGAFEITYPHYHDQTTWALKLHCYLLGPGRHYGWDGQTLAECVTKAEIDINKWLEES